ncbi:MAG: flavodoxin domain-containing protein [Candidatus Hodarchaeales archaeon]|jgi:menaquinone-dependent protoporphyrinogen IX oxidase
MSKTILAYVTRYGATTETAKEIVRVINENFNIDVDLVDIKANKKLDISSYENVILGVSVAKFRWAKEGKKFLKNDFSGKKLFVFVSSGTAGEAYQRKDFAEYEKIQTKYIDKVLKKQKLQFASRKALGGRFVGAFSKRGDNRDWDAIRGWAKEIGKIISEA